MAPWGLLVRHHLRLVFRDRNARLYGILLPLVLYPATLYLAREGRHLLLRMAEGRPSPVVADLPGEKELVDRLARAGSAARLALAPLPPGREARALLLAGEVEAAVLRPARGGPLAVLRRTGSEPSARAATRLAELLARERAAAAGAPPPPRLRLEAAPGPGAQGAALLARILPSILLLVAALGALSPALELTAGERERGTNETSRLWPLSPGWSAASRLTAVGLAASLAVALNLAGMLLATGPLLGSQGVLLPDPPLPALAVLAGLGLLLAFLFAGLLLLAGARAASFRAGLAYATPLTGLAFLPGLAALTPDLELDGTTALVPLVNAALAVRGALEGNLAARPLALAAGELALLAAVLGLLAWRRLAAPGVEA